MEKERFVVGLYQDNGHFIDRIIFKHKWQAKLFHRLLNISKRHMGTREY